MTRTLAVLLGAVALVWTASADAQEKPSFAGKWTLIPDTTAAAAAGGGGGGGGGGRAGRGMGGGRGGALGGLGPEATITQDATTLTVVRTTQLGEVRTVYNLDGSPSRNQLTLGGARGGGGGGGGGMGAVESVSTARWDGNKLVVTTSIELAGNSIQTTMSMSLDASGVLVLETVNPGMGGGAPTATTTRYRKG